MYLLTLFSIYSFIFNIFFHVCFDLRAIVNFYTGRLVEESLSRPKLLPPCEIIEIKSTEFEK